MMTTPTRPATRRDATGRRAETSRRVGVSVVRGRARPAAGVGAGVAARGAVSAGGARLTLVRSKARNGNALVSHRPAGRNSDQVPGQGRALFRVGGEGAAQDGADRVGLE